MVWIEREVPTAPFSLSAHVACQEKLKRLKEKWNKEDPPAPKQTQKKPMSRIEKFQEKLRKKNKKPEEVSPPQPEKSAVEETQQVQEPTDAALTRIWTIEQHSLEEEPRSMKKKLRLQMDNTANAHIWYQYRSPSDDSFRQKRKTVCTLDDDGENLQPSAKRQRKIVEDSDDDDYQMQCDDKDHSLTSNMEEICCALGKLQL